MASVGQAFRQGVDENRTREYLERTRNQKLAQTGLTLQHNQLVNTSMKSNQDYVQQKRDYETQQRELQIQQLRQVRSQVASSNIDQAVLNSAKGDYEGMRKVLMNGTEGNPNSEIKQLVEGQLGGKVVNVRKPTSDDTLEEITPDQIAVEILADSGEKQVHLMSNRQLGIMTGVHKRVGMKSFNDHMDGKHSKAVDNALQLSIGFDGQVKNLQQNLVRAAAIGNDPEAVKLLGLISETQAKDGESLIQALTAEYGKASDEDKPAILAKIKEVSTLMGKFNKKKEAKKANPKEQVQQAIVDAFNRDDTEKVEELQKLLHTIDPKATKPMSAAQQRLETHKKATETLASTAVADIENGTVSDTDYTKRITDAIGDGTQAQRRALAMNEYARVSKQNKSLNLNDPALKTGRVTPEGKRVLEAYKAIEVAGGAKTSDSANKKAVEGFQATKAIMANASNVLKSYDEAKDRGLFKAGQSLGVVKAMNTGIFKFLGDLSFGGDEEANSKSKAKFISRASSQVSLMDRFDELHKKDKLTNDENEEMDTIQQKLQIDKAREWDTQTYLVLKKLLQSISGQGVTNQELEAFKVAFSGQNFDSIDSVMKQLTESAIGQLNLTNASFNDLVQGGMPYTATKGMLDIRRAGSYIINSHPEKPINQGLTPNVGMQPTIPPAMYTQVAQKIATKYATSPANVKSIVGRILDYQSTGTNQSMESALGLSKSEVAQYLAIAQEMNKAEEAYMKANVVYDKPNPTPQGAIPLDIAPSQGK